MLVFSWCLIAYTANVPWLDDFEVGPLSLFNWLHTHDFQQKMAQIWAPNNEHRVVTLKLLVLFNYYVFGQLNIKWMIWQSHLYLIPLFIILWRSMPKERRLAYFSPIPFLFLNFQYYLSSYWMIAAVQHNFVIGFGAIAMYLIVKPKSARFYLAIILTIFACLSNSDGLFFIPIGAIVLLMQHRLKELFIWLLLLTSATVLFFWKYPSMSYHETGMHYFCQHPFSSLKGFFVFMGGGFDFWYREQSAFRLFMTAFMGIFLVGIVILTLYQFVKARGFSQLIQRWNDKKFAQAPALFIISMLLFIMMNAGAISILRSSFGEYVFLIGNYKIYPTLALVFVYALSIYAWPEILKQLRWVIVGGMVFWAASIWNSLGDIRQRKATLMHEYASFRKGGAGLGFTAQQQKTYGLGEIIQFLESKGIYHAE